MILAIAYIANFFIPLNIEHITERLANFIVLVLGEDVASLFFVETGSYVFEPYLLGLLGMVIVFGFQMLYFDVEETSRHRLLHAMRRRKYTGQIWSILHILYTMALVVLAAGVALAIDGTLPNEHRKSKHSREEAEIRSRIYFTGGFAGALMASTLIGSLAPRTWAADLDTALTNAQSLSADQLASEEDFWYFIQQSFTVSSGLINLNNGGVSPAPRSVQEAMKRYYDYSNEAPTYYMWRILDQGREPLRKRLAELAGCSKEEIAINRNSSEGLETVIFGLTLEKGDEIVAARQDYPNMVNA